MAKATFGPDTWFVHQAVDEPVEEILAPGTEPAFHLQNLVDEKLFVFLLEYEVHKAIRFQYPLSILCLAPDLPPTDASPLANQLARVAVRHVRATDAASILPPSNVALLLVDAEARNVAAILQRLRQAFEPLPLPATRKERRLTFSAGAGCYPRTAANGRELIVQALDLMKRAKTEGGDRLYVAS